MSYWDIGNRIRILLFHLISGWSCSLINTLLGGECRLSTEATPKLTWCCSCRGLWSQLWSTYKPSLSFQGENSSISSILLQMSEPQQQLGPILLLRFWRRRNILLFVLVSLLIQSFGSIFGRFYTQTIRTSLGGKHCDICGKLSI